MSIIDDPETTADDSQLDGEPDKKRRLIVGISGATGVVYGVRMLEALLGLPIESHLVMSKSAELTVAYETDLKAADIKAMADVVYPIGDVGAAIASGSYRTMGMVIAPCSIKTMSDIATGVTANLMTRAADVTLKERRRLVLMLRETPLHAGHIRSMLQATENGAIIAPPVPAFYTRPESVEALVDQTVGRVLDLFEIESGLTRRWGEDVGTPNRG
ncbi:MAG: UbiX family flavin prenyltransferase [Pseudomonadota bacterium]